MVKSALRTGSNFFTRRQATILSAAVVIMVMIAASRILGLVRNRVLAHFFSVETLSIYFAAFRLPEVIFEVLVFGALSSAFIPTFTSYLSRQGKKEAWYVASAVLNIAFLIFAFLALLIFVFARPIYQVIAAGFTPDQLDQIVSLARILLLAQGFFVLSYFLTGVLESLQRFLVPAIAPLLYNLGIILGAAFFSGQAGIYAPTLGALAGAFMHFAIQLPLAFYLGFRFQRIFDFSHPGVKEIGRLAAPRVVELSFLQVGKSVELFLASLISTAAYTYFTFANSLQLLPVGLFGISIAKASLPTLSYQATEKNLARFKKTFLASFNEIIFLVVPCAVFLAVLRIPIVRLAFGAARFTWTSTVQTGYTLSAFSLGILSQALVYLLNRAFYALHDTATPVKISVSTIILNICFGLMFILVFRWPIWGLALAFSLSSIIQLGALVFFLNRRLKGLDRRRLILPFAKISFSSLFSGGVMFFLLKILDRAAWDKKLSFLGRLGLVLPTTFDRFVLDTRYTFNLILLTALVALIGGSFYLVLVFLLRVEELSVLARLLRRLKKAKPPLPPEPSLEEAV
jgi:putative peptidoglycan lipid II flippase